MFSLSRLSTSCTRGDNSVHNGGESLANSGQHCEKRGEPVNENLSSTDLNDKNYGQPQIIHNVIRSNTSEDCGYPQFPRAL